VKGQSKLFYYAATNCVMTKVVSSCRLNMSGSKLFKYPIGLLLKTTS